MEHYEYTSYSAREENEYSVFMTWKPSSNTSVRRGSNVYKEVWKPSTGEELKCKREPLNIIGRCAVCVL